MSRKTQVSAKQRIGKNNKRKIRILHIRCSLTIGGTEAHIITLSNAIDKNRFEVWINVYEDKELDGSDDKTLAGMLDQEVRLIKFEPKKIGSLLSMRHLPGNLRHILFLYRTIKTHKIDLVHTHAMSEGMRAWIAAKIAGVPTVYNPMQVLIPEYRREWLPVKYRLLGKILDRLVTKHIAVSDYIKKDLITKRNIPEKRVSVQYAGIDIEKYQPSPGSVKARDEFKLSDETPVAGIVARLSPEKGIHKAIKAFPYVVKEVPTSQLLIIGDGPLRDELEQMCKVLGVSDNVIFAGFRHDVDQLMKIIDIYLQTTNAPNVGITTLEAMATGKPLITVIQNEDEREMARETLIDGENGFIVPDVPSEIAEKIVFLLKDRALARKQGQLSRRLVEEKFDIKKNIKSLEELYESLIDRRG